MEKKIINCNLIENTSSEVLLEFDFDEKTYINLNSDDQNKLSATFIPLIRETLKCEIEIKLLKAQQIKNKLFEEIADEYIADLNKELIKIYEDVQKELTNN